MRRSRARSTHPASARRSARTTSAPACTMSPARRGQTAFPENAAGGHWYTPAMHTLRRLLLCPVLFGVAATHAASPAPVAAKNGMVVTAQQHATRVGVDILKSGGNAVDAAIAVGYALSVVYPAAGNLGGGGFMTVQFADGRKTFIDFREVAPLAAKANMYLDAAGNV